MVTFGIKKARYGYIVIDDFWVGGRDAKNELYTDKNRFPSASNGIMNSVDQQTGLEKYAGPGGWNDPDLLVTGLFGKEKSSSENGRFKGCSLTEYRSQFILWCMMASPRMLNLDIRSLDRDTRNIILDKALIAINQDSLGNQASSIYKKNNLEVFKKELTGHRYAICVLNRSGDSQNFSLNL